MAVDRTPKPPDAYTGVEWYGTRWEFREVADRLRHCGTFFEVGCGTGYFAREVRDFCTSYVGVDFNPAAVEEARRRFPATFRFVTDSEEGFAAYAGTGVDVFCAFHTIEHTPDPDAFLREAVARLRPRYIAVSVPNEERLLVRAGLRDAWDHPPHHILRFTSAGMHALLGRVGARCMYEGAEPLRDVEFALAAKARLGDLPARAAARSFSLLPQRVRPRTGQARLFVFETGR